MNAVCLCTKLGANVLVTSLVPCSNYFILHTDDLVCGNVF